MLYHRSYASRDELYKKLFFILQMQHQAGDKKQKVKKVGELLKHKEKKKEERNYRN